MAECEAIYCWMGGVPARRAAALIAAKVIVSRDGGAAIGAGT